MSFVIRTDKMSEPMYFVGYVKGDILGTLCTVVSSIIFEAARIHDRAEADRVVAEDLGADWTVSEIVEEGASANLKPSRRRKRA